MSKELWDGATATTSAITFTVSRGEVPGKLIAGGMQAGESIAVQTVPFNGGTPVALKSGGTAKTLDLDNNEYLIESPGQYKLVLTTGGADTAAGFQVGYQG